MARHARADPARGAHEDEARPGPDGAVDRPHRAPDPGRGGRGHDGADGEDALRRRGITAFDEFADQVVLETPTAELIPIVPDWRGRAFFQDPRLRNRRVELVGYRRQGLPYLQVLMVFTFDKRGIRQYTDYWCEICSIPMYEIKPCDCCQAEIDLRFQPRDLPLYLRADPKKTVTAPSKP